MSKPAPIGACVRCHERKLRESFPIGRRGRRSTVCYACIETEAWRHYHERIVTRSTWIVEGGVKVRRCAKCGAVRPMTRRHFYPKPPKGKGRFSYYCKTCDDMIKHAARKRVLADPKRAPRERANKARAAKRYRERHPDAARAAARRWKAMLKADPEKWAKYLEDSRINYRLRQERKGRAVKVKIDSRMARAKRQSQRAEPFLPSAPIAAFMASMIEQRREAVEQLGLDATGVIGEVCNEFSVPERTYRQWREGKQPTVRRSTLERIFDAAEVGWWVVYSYDDHAHVFIGDEALA